jgi:hypothetical protein
MSIEAMKQALEVLEQINQLSIGENAIALPGEIDAAMDNLRAAIEQPLKIDPAGCYIRVGEVSEPISVARQWIGLTDREATDLLDRASYTGVTNSSLLLILVEEKLKEKNAA